MGVGKRLLTRPLLVARRIIQQARHTYVGSKIHTCVVRFHGRLGEETPEVWSWRQSR